MKTLLRVTFLGLALSAPLMGQAESCFHEHVTSSISINKARKKVYAELTNGNSDRIFNRLITAEYLTLLPALNFDRKAHKYHEKGIDLYCKEFVSMIRTPEFDPRTRRVPGETFRSFDWESYKNRIVKAIEAGDSQEVRKVTLEGMLELRSQPNFHCFTRHFLESIYRIAYFVPLRTEQAKAAGLKDPKKMMFDVMKFHTVGLEGCNQIDTWALPIQKSGISILCTEIPNIIEDLDHPELEILKHE